MAVTKPVVVTSEEAEVLDVLARHLSQFSLNRVTWEVVDSDGVPMVFMSDQNRRYDCLSFGKVACSTQKGRRHRRSTHRQLD
jgi:hypothetical protein